MLLIFFSRLSTKKFRNTFIMQSIIIVSKFGSRLVRSWSGWYQDCFYHTCTGLEILSNKQRTSYLELWYFDSSIVIQFFIFFTDILLKIVRPLWSNCYEWNISVKNINILIFPNYFQIYPRDQARERLGQNSRPRGRNFALNGTQGEVGVSLKKKKKIFFFF